MYPNEEPQPISSTYLDQIATPQTAGKGLMTHKIVVIGGIIVALMFLLITMSAISSAASAGPNSIKRLSARLDSVQKITESATPIIGSSKLREYNSILKLSLIGIIHDIEPVQAANGIKPKSIDKNIVASESNTKALASLEDARLNAVYDRAYAREMTYQLDRVLSLMTQIGKQTNKVATKKFINDSIVNLQKSRDQFDSFAGAS